MSTLDQVLGSMLVIVPIVAYFWGFYHGYRDGYPDGLQECAKRFGEDQGFRTSMLARRST